MKKVFVDTAAWIALVNKTDVLHGRAREIREDLLRQHTRFVTSGPVLYEIANSLCRAAFRPAAVKLLDFILSSAGLVEVVEVEGDVFEKACRLFLTRMDKEWSLTDCSSFVIMKKFHIKTAFTSDRHFVQAGFDILIQE